MSYCRFSSDDFQCDVYVYESIGDFFAIHVAANRVVYAEPLPADVPFPFGKNDDSPEFRAWFDRHHKVQAMVGEATRVPIDLPHAGESFEMDDAGSCADKLEELRALGYQVPQYAIDTLREEQSGNEEQA